MSWRGREGNLPSVGLPTRVPFFEGQIGDQVGISGPIANLTAAGSAEDLQGDVVDPYLALPVESDAECDPFGVRGHCAGDFFRAPRPGAGRTVLAEALLSLGPAHGEPKAGVVALRQLGADRGTQAHCPAAERGGIEALLRTRRLAGMELFVVHPEAPVVGRGLPRTQSGVPPGHNVDSTLRRLLQGIGQRGLAAGGKNADCGRKRLEEILQGAGERVGIGRVFSPLHTGDRERAPVGFGGLIARMEVADVAEKLREGHQVVEPAVRERPGWFVADGRGKESEKEKPCPDAEHTSTLSPAPGQEFLLRFSGPRGHENRPLAVPARSLLFRCPF